MKAILIKIEDGKESVSEIEPTNKKTFQLEELYNLLNCTTIELLYLDNAKYMIIDEEGKLKPNIVNKTATTLYKYDIIVGNAIICDPSQFK